MDTKKQTIIQWAAELGDTIPQEVLDCTKWGWGYIMVQTAINYPVEREYYDIFKTAVNI